MRASITAGFLLVFAAETAHADPVWQRSPTPGITVGLELVSNLGPAEDRKRFGIALTGAAQALWYEEKIGWDGPSPLSPLGRVSAHVGWTHPVVYAQLSVQGGALYPLEVYDVGMIPLAGWIAGGGVGMATDGWAGPFLATTLIAPFVEGRFDLAHWKKDWHAPRLSIGVVIPATARSEFAISTRGSAGPPQPRGSAPGSPGTIEPPVGTAP